MANMYNRSTTIITTTKAWLINEDNIAIFLEEPFVSLSLIANTCNLHPASAHIGEDAIGATCLARKKYNQQKSQTSPINIKGEHDRPLSSLPNKLWVKGEP